MSNKVTLAVAAIVELLAGLALIVHPAFFVRLFLGADLLGAGLIIGRVAGFGLFSLAVACWPRSEATRPAFRAMLSYNALVAAYLLYLWNSGESTGRLLLPTVALHATLALLCARALFGEQVVKDGNQ